MIGSKRRCMIDCNPSDHRLCRQMSIFVPRRNYDPVDPEVMDRPGNDPELLAGDLENLRVINRRFGGLRAIRRNILPLIGRIDPQRTIEILDLGTGSADYPVHLATWLKNLGRKVHIEAVDKNPFMVGIGREMTSAFPEITVKEMDVLSLPYPDRSFDVVLCSSAIHHFSRRDVVRILSEMNRLSRFGFVVNDLHRSWLGAWTVWLYAHLSTTNPITRHDAYVSILRGFRENELAGMAQEAEVRSFVVVRQVFFRLILTGMHP